MSNIAHIKNIGTFPKSSKINANIFQKKSSPHQTSVFISKFPYYFLFETLRSAFFTSVHSPLS